MRNAEKLEKRDKRILGFILGNLNLPLTFYSVKSIEFLYTTDRKHVHTQYANFASINFHNFHHWQKITKFNICEI